MSRPELTVIIPTHDRAESLLELLDALCNQTLDRQLFEVLVVDNGEPRAIDATVAAFAGQRDLPVRYVRENDPGLHAARHRGMRHALADILVFCDDDIIPFGSWLEAIWSSFRDHPEAVLVGGKALPRYEKEPPPWLEGLWITTQYGKVNGWLSLVDLGEETRRVPAGYVYGCNFTIRRHVLEQCGGFHPDAMPWNLRHLRGDGETHVSEFVDSRGLVALYNPAASVYHRVPAARMTKAYLRRRAFLQAISYSYTMTRRHMRVAPRMRVIGRRIADVLVNEVVLANGRPRGHWLHLIRGLIWHQLIILRRPALLEWIRKENYLD